MPNQPFQYSTGFDMLRAYEALKDRVKWSSDTTGGSNTPSLSGRNFDDGSFHALVTESNLNNVQNTAGISSAAFTTLRSAFAKAAIIRSLSSVFGDIYEIERRMIVEPFDYSNRPTDLPSQDFVGYRIEIAKSYLSMVQVSAVQLNFTESTPVTLYVYRAGQATPWWTQTVNAQADLFSVIRITDLILSYGLTKACVFYFGYKISELQNSALPYSDIHNGISPSGIMFNCEMINAALPVVDNNYQLTDRNYGMNIEVCSMWDYTENIVNAPWLFDELIGLNCAAMLIEQLIFSTRINAKEVILKESLQQMVAQLELYGTAVVSDAPETVGLRKRIDEQVRLVRKAFLNRKSGVVSLYEEPAYKPIRY